MNSEPKLTKQNWIITLNRKYGRYRAASRESERIWLLLLNLKRDIMNGFGALSRKRTVRITFVKKVLNSKSHIWKDVSRVALLSACVLVLDFFFFAWDFTLIYVFTILQYVTHYIFMFYSCTMKVVRNTRNGGLNWISKNKSYFKTNSIKQKY